jgi:hypothetical protein
VTAPGLLKGVAAIHGVGWADCVVPHPRSGAVLSGWVMREKIPPGGTSEQLAVPGCYALAHGEGGFQ